MSKTSIIESALSVSEIFNVNESAITPEIKTADIPDAKVTEIVALEEFAMKHLRGLSSEILSTE